MHPCHSVPGQKPLADPGTREFGIWRPVSSRSREFVVDHQRPRQNFCVLGHGASFGDRPLAEAVLMDVDVYVCEQAPPCPNPILCQIVVRLGHGFRVHLQRNIDCRVTFVLGLRLSAFRGPISRSQIVAVPVTSTESTRILSTSVVQTARPISSHSGAKMKALGPVAPCNPVVVECRSLSAWWLLGSVGCLLILIRDVDAWPRLLEA